MEKSNTNEVVDIHICKFKKAKLQHAMQNYNGDYFCCMCFQYVPLNQVHESVKRRKK